MFTPINKFKKLTLKSSKYKSSNCYQVSINQKHLKCRRQVTSIQEGSQQTIGGGSTCSNDDVINSMTSLLLPYSAQKVGGQLTPLTPLRLPPCWKPISNMTHTSQCAWTLSCEPSFNWCFRHPKRVGCIRCTSIGVTFSRRSAFYLPPTPQTPRPVATEMTQMEWKTIDN